MLLLYSWPPATPSRSNAAKHEVRRFELWNNFIDDIELFIESLPELPECLRIHHNCHITQFKLDLSICHLLLKKYTDISKDTSQKIINIELFFEKAAKAKP